MCVYVLVCLCVEYVDVCMYRFRNVCVCVVCGWVKCVCVGFVMCGHVYVWIL